MVYGFARHLRDALPNASFIAFTGTPVSLTDRNTRAVLGDYISIYDIQQGVADGATVPIYYESRVAKLDLPEDLKPVIDEESRRSPRMRRKGSSSGSSHGGLNSKLLSGATGGSGATPVT